MTDNEIIKTLKCCVSGSGCFGCPACKQTVDDEVDCNGIDWTLILDLINRQKAEIERLSATPKCVYAWDGETTEFCVEGPCSVEKTIEAIKTEAIKEFLKKAKALSYESSDWSHGEHPIVIELDDLETICEEMVGE